MAAISRSSSRSRADRDGNQRGLSFRVDVDTQNRCRSRMRSRLSRSSFEPRRFERSVDVHPGRIRRAVGTIVADRGGEHGTACRSPPKRLLGGVHRLREGAVRLRRGLGHTRAAESGRDGRRPTTTTAITRSTRWYGRAARQRNRRSCHAFDQIVIGSHDRNRADRILSGSVFDAGRPTRADGCRRTRS